MRLLNLLGPVAVFGFLGCAASTEHRTNTEDHWNMKSIGPRVGRAFLGGYDREKDGSYDGYQWQKKQDINLTMRRHFFNENPENPFQPASDYWERARKPDNTLSRPVTYIHFEAFAVGAIVYGAGGPFLAIPIDSVMGTFETYNAKNKKPRVATTTSMYEDLPDEVE